MRTISAGKSSFPSHSPSTSQPSSSSPKAHLTSSRAAFTGTRITLRQVSPESEAIYDFIISLYRARSGDWASLARDAGVSAQDLQYFLEYAAQFLGNCGNY